MKLAIADVLRIHPWIVRFPDDCSFVASGRKMPVQAICGYIQRAVFKPFNRYVRAVEIDVLHLRKGLDPIDVPRDFAPKAVLVFHGLLVERLKLLGIYSCLRHEVSMRIQDASHSSSSYVASFSQFEGCWISPNLSASRIKNRLEFEYSELSFRLVCLADCFPEYPWRLKPRLCLPPDAIQVEQRNFEWTGDESLLLKRVDCRDALPAQNPKTTTRFDCACVARAGNMPELATAFRTDRQASCERRICYPKDPGELVPSD